MREAIVALRGKYEEMLALRRDAPVEPPRERLASLAARFPGALREIDELPLAEIERRITLLLHAELEPARAAEWVRPMSRFHALARGVLFAKRSIGDSTSTRASWPEEAASWEADLARVAKPPRGRLMDLVYERLAHELGTTTEHAKELVFGRRRRNRLT